MVRPRKLRFIGKQPEVKIFKPVGVPFRMVGNITLTLDEYEALRLCDYEGMEHAEAAELMNISRPTFTWLIEKARNKIATAIVEGKAITVEGGNVVFQERKRCEKCNKEIPTTEKHRCKE